jgi:hypothetical protein
LQVIIGDFYSFAPVFNVYTYTKLLSIILYKLNEGSKKIQIMADNIKKEVLVDVQIKYNDAINAIGIHHL